LTLTTIYDRFLTSGESGKGLLNGFSRWVYLPLGYDDARVAGDTSQRIEHEINPHHGL
jgi:hypothetical protein